MRTKVLMALLICTIAVTFLSSPVTGKSPRFSVVGEGNFEAFCLQDGTCVVTDVPYTAGVYEDFKQQEQAFLFITHSTDDVFAFTREPLEAETRKIVRDMVKCGPSDKDKVDEVLEMLHIQEARWKTVEVRDGRFILSASRSHVSPDHKKLIVSSESEDTLWIYDADQDIIRVMNVNGNAYKREPDDIILWFSHIRWSQDGKRLAYDSNKKRKGSGVWILDYDGTEKCAYYKEGPSLSVLGWSHDNRIVVQVESRQGEIGLCRPNGVYERVATGVWAMPYCALSPDGRFLAVMKVDPNGDVYGACIINLESKKVYDFTEELAGSNMRGSSFVWSVNSQRVAFFASNRKDQDPALPYTTGARLAVIDVTQKASPRIEMIDAPYDRTWFYIGGSISWAGDNVVIASLTNGLSVAFEVK